MTRARRARPLARLSKKEEAARLAAAQGRLLALRLRLGGPDRRRRARAAAVRRVRGLGRVRQGRRDQAPRRAARPAPRARRASSPRRRRREAPPLPAGASGRRCPAGAAWRCSTARGTAACSSSASRASRPRRSGSAPTTRSTSSSACSRVEGMILVKFWLHISDEEQLEALRGAREGPAEAVEADRRGLAQPREAAGVRGRRRGDARAHRPRAAPWTSSRPSRSATRA